MEIVWQIASQKGVATVNTFGLGISSIGISLQKYYLDAAR